MSVASQNTSSVGGAEKPKLGLGSIINLSMGFMGIQMGFGLQNGNASRILANYGADVHHLSWFWIVAPLTGLIVQPIIGHMGDNTWGKLGRRKPYFLIGALLASLGLIFLPNSNIIAGEGMSAVDFMGISAILWIGIGFLALMDVSFNISMEPFRALVGDMLPKSQGTLGFSVQTILIGLGAILGSFLPYILSNWFGISNTPEGGDVAMNVVWSFYIGAIILMGTILYTIITTKEYPPEDFARFQGIEDSEGLEKSPMSDIFKDAWKMPKRMRRLGLVQFFSWFALFTMWVFTTVAISQNAYDVEVDEEAYQLALTKLESLPIPADEKEAEDQAKLIESFKNIEVNEGLYFVNSSQAGLFANSFFVSDQELEESTLEALNSKPGNFASEIETKTPAELLRDSEILGYLLDESAFSFNQDLKTSLVYKRVKVQHELGGDWTGVLFGTYNAIATLFAFLIPFIAARTSRKFVHIISLLAGGLGLISMLFIHDPTYLLIPMIGIGFAWASILTMPYALLIDSLPPAKMGVYMGIFNFFIVIPQIVNALVGGPIVHAFFNNYAIYYLAFGGVLFVIAALLTLRIKEPLFGEAEIIKLREEDALKKSTN